MYVYDCNAILTTAINIRSDKEMMQAFTELNEDLKSCGINTDFHFIDNEASTALNMKITAMNIKYQLVPPSNLIANNAYRAIQTSKDHFISGLCSVDKYFHLQLWYIILHQATISLSFLKQSRTLPHISAYTHIF